MEHTPPVPGGPDQTMHRPHRGRRRRLLAIAAGGLVLGVGAHATLAGWTDRELAQADFGSGLFGIEASADGQTWADHVDAPLAITFPTATALTPGDTVVAPYALRLTGDSEYQAALSLSNAAAATGAFGSHLSYSIDQVDSWDACTSTGDLIASGTFGEAGTPVLPTTTTTITLDLNDTPVFLCLRVSADQTLEQDKADTATWTFTAESGDPL